MVPVMVAKPQDPRQAFKPEYPEIRQKPSGLGQTKSGQSAPLRRRNRYG